MGEVLCITVRLLSEFWHGRSEEGGLEYPPSPFRVFQALVAAAYTGAYAKDAPIEKRRALEWLEKQDPPLIIAPPYQELRGFDVYVPNNDADKLPRSKRLTLKKFRPIWLGMNATLHYLWQVSSIQNDVLETLQREVKRISVLGRGIDWVVGEACIFTEEQLRNLSGQWFRPVLSESGPRRLRVPTAGSLESLKRLYEARLRFTQHYEMPDRTGLVFRKVTYQTDGWNDGGQRRPFAAFALIFPGATAFEQKRRAFWHTQVARVAATLRHTALESARGSQHEFPGGIERFVAGHAPEGEERPLERFSYLPLPSINHRFADGGLRRVLVVEPAGGDGKHARWAQRALDGQLLKREQDKQPLAELSSELSSADRALVQCYTKSAYTWLSATAVVLPGRDDGRYHKALKLLRKALEDARIPESIVQEVRLQKAPFWPGSAHPSAYFMPEYMRHYSAWHVLIRFTRPFYGPLAIGVGRHVGLGLFAAADE